LFSYGTFVSSTKLEDWGKSSNFVEEAKIPGENPQSSNFVEEAKIPGKNHQSSNFVETKIPGENPQSSNFVETKIPGGRFYPVFFFPLQNCEISRFHLALVSTKLGDQWFSSGIFASSTKLRDRGFHLALSFLQN
jgi:hypothetical protein